MATRKTRIDVTASAIITEAGAFPPEATIPNKDEQRIAVYPMRIYEGYNYLPTYYGYKSYFGLDSTLEATGLPADAVVEDIFVYQTRSFKNVIIALTDRGIYMREGTAWVHILVLDTPAANTSRFWTKTVINQIFFLYYQGGDVVYVIEELIDGAGINMDVFNGMKVQPERVDTESLTLQVFSFVPTLLNMEGQVGIYKAGGSLGFWDSDDSIAWSAVADYTDFEPSLTTLANTIKLQDQVGKITQIFEHGDGFIVYCTRSIVYVLEDNDALLRFRSTVILGNVGVAYPREITVAQPDTTHYAWTSMGLIQVMNGQAEPIVPDFSDHVKRTKTPQYLDMLNNRYLCVGVMDPNFIPGNVDFSAITVDPADIVFPGVTIPGVFIEGTTIPGDMVCLPNNEYDYVPDWDDPLVDPDPNDPTIPDYPKQEVLDSGYKPYHVLQIYRQWKYNGATIHRNDVTLGDVDLTLYRVLEGTTDAAYQILPPKMHADEVFDYNFGSIPQQLEQRQAEVYDEKYSESRLKYREAWDKVQNELMGTYPGGGTVLKLAQEREVTIDLGHPMYANMFPPAIDVVHYDDLLSPGRKVYVKDIGGSSYLLVAHYIIADGGKVFMGFVQNPQTYFALPFVPADFLFSLGSGYSSWPAGPARPAWPSTFVYVGDASEYAHLTDANWDIYLDRNVESFEKSRYFSNLEWTDEVEGHLIDPDAIESRALLTTEGGKEAKKISTLQDVLYAISVKLAKGNHIILDGLPISMTFYRKSLHIMPKSGRMHSSGRPTPESQNPVDHSYRWSAPITTVPDLTFSLLVDRDVPYSVLEANLQQQLSDAYSPAIDAAEQAAREAALVAKSSAVSAIAGYYTGSVRSCRDTPAGGESCSLLANWYDDTVGILFSFSPGDGTQAKLGLTAITYKAIEARHVNIEVTPEPDGNELLFGRVPTQLPPTAVGATAIRQMTEEDKRGLIAVHQHFYSQNRRRDRLDSSFLVKAAGRVDVPLGTPLGSPLADQYPSRFTEKAEWANRWYELRYEPVLPEGGWPSGEFWPPESTDPNWDPTTPFPPVDTRGWELVQQAVVCGVTEPITTPDIYVPPVSYAPWTIENPPLTWVLQNGSVAPYNPTMFGAYVYDLHLQKWGVFKGNHKHLVDYQPINNYSPGSVDYKNFLIEGGCLTEDLAVALFNDYPTDNYIKYGKYQHVSSEFSAIEEVHLTFRGESTGLVAVQFSLDGRSPEYGHSIAEWFNQALSHTLNCDIVGKWATITVTGHYDLSGMTVKSHPTGRR